MYQVPSIRIEDIEKPAKAEGKFQMTLTRKTKGELLKDAKNGMQLQFISCSNPWRRVTRVTNKGLYMGPSFLQFPKNAKDIDYNGEQLFVTNNGHTTAYRVRFKK